MSRPGINGARRAIAAAVMLGALVGGCSDIYFDRRETVALGGPDAVAANEVEEMVDPWPAHSNDKNLAFNGERMQRAVECYRINKVTAPADLDPSDNVGAPPPPAATQCQGRMAVGSAAPATGAPGNPEPNK